MSSNTNLFSDCFLESIVNGCLYGWEVGKYCCHQTTIDSLPVFERKNYFVVKSIVSRTVVHFVLVEKERLLS